MLLTDGIERPRGALRQRVLLDAPHHLPERGVQGAGLVLSHGERAGW
jgi:hypothetical protein